MTYYTIFLARYEYLKLAPKKVSYKIKVSYKSSLKQPISTFNTAVPNLFGTGDRFRGRQFFHERGRRYSYGMIQVHYIFCALYFYYYYIEIYNETIIQLTIMLTGGGAQVVMRAMGTGCNYRWRFATSPAHRSPATHLLLCGPVPNRPWTGPGGASQCSLGAVILNPGRSPARLGNIAISQMPSLHARPMTSGAGVSVFCPRWFQCAARVELHCLRRMFPDTGLYSMASISLLLTTKALLARACTGSFWRVLLPTKWGEIISRPPHVS